MERPYYTRESTDLEKEKYTYICRDEKDIPLKTFEPIEMLQYRGYTIPIYFDDYGQQYFIIFMGEDWGNPLGSYDDFCDFIDNKLDYLIPTESPNQVISNLHNICSNLRELIRTNEGDVDMNIYPDAVKTAKEVTKYLGLVQVMSSLLEIKNNDKTTYDNKRYLVKLREDIFTDDILLDQLKRFIENIDRKENK